jgi:transposase
MQDAALTSLPDDPEILKRMLIERDRSIVTLQNERDRWKLKHDEKEIDRLRLEVELLRYKKWYYGRKADQLTTPDDLAQMLLEFGQQLENRPVDLDDIPADVNLRNVETKTIRRVSRGRRNLAAFNELPVTRKEHDLPEAQKSCPCCGQMRRRIGSESSWQIEYIPGRFERIEHIRHKYACKHCDHNGDGGNIELADKPTQPIEKGLAGPGLLAFIVTSKFADYLPLYRLESIFERNGFEIDRATMSIWCRDVAEITRPLYDLMVQRVLQSHVISTDDTVMPMLAPGSGKTKQGRMWIYIGDDDHPYNLFDFTLSRSRDGPVKFLSDYNQTLLADGYGGYDGVVTRSGITRAGCWAHARRKFVDAEKAHPAIARDAVALIKRLYAIEDQGRLLSTGDRLRLRQSQSTPILRELHERLLTWKDELLPKHPMAEAVNYTLNQWQALSVFASDGAVAIDNNASERQIKRIVLNRKNSLFVGNQRGGATAAILATLTSTCRRHDIDPQFYLTQLLTNLPATPMSQLQQWLPDQWKKNRPAPPEVWFT